MLVLTEPSKMDPAALRNSAPVDATLGNALYGQLVVDDISTGQVEPALAEDLSTTDGVSWVLKLRPGTTFSDGSPFDAAAVKANWERHQDKGVASLSASAARAVASMAVTDPQTLSFTLAGPNAQFGQLIASTGMNWVASPAALAKGQQAFDAEPVGAGPFVLSAWQRQDRIELSKNPRYYDAPRPYLDGLVLRGIPDSESRFSTLQSGGADLSYSGNGDYDFRAQDAGLSVESYPSNGAYANVFNTRKAPFDDPEIRRAVVRAIDVDAINDAVYGGHGVPPRSLFRDTSPFFNPDTPVPALDRAAAQKVFDRLAAAGTPLTFDFVVRNTTESMNEGLAIQAQLEGYGNVKVNLKPADIATHTAALTKQNFDLISFSVAFADPEPVLYQALKANSPQNYSGVSDPQLDAALDQGRAAVDIDERKAAYTIVQQRFAELNPMMLWTSPTPSVQMTSSVTGVSFYGDGSIRLDGAWKAGGV